MSKPVGPYTPIIRSGNLLFSSGQIGINDGALADGLEAQLRQVFVNLRAVLASEGASLADVVKTTVFLVDMADYGAVNEIYMEEFPLGALIEIEAIAVAGDA